MATVRRVLAPNAGPLTGPGTNTWVVGDPPAVAVIDPGPSDARHLAAIDRALRGASLAAVLLTHVHPDHAPLAQELASRHQARVLAWPELADGDVIRVASLEITALHTPGHCGDHLCYWLAGDRALFTGDLVLGRGSSLVAFPDGDVRQFLASLDRIEGLQPRLLFPGHWGPVREPAARIAECRQHRLDREADIVAELSGGEGSADNLARRVYRDLEPALLPAAQLTLLAHLHKLIEDGRATKRRIEGEEIYGLLPG